MLAMIVVMVMMMMVVMEMMLMVVLLLVGCIGHYHLGIVLGHALLAQLLHGQW